MSRKIPPQRWEALAAVAAASKTQTVLVVCCSRAVRHQYEQAVPRLGGNLNNVTFRILPSAISNERTPS